MKMDRLYRPSQLLYMYNEKGKGAYYLSDYLFF
jgi:hypothetical protein